MISGEQEARIRQLYFAERWPIGTIARQLGLHHSTVRRVLGLQSVASQDQSTSRPTLIAPYRDFVEQTLEKYPRLHASRVFEMVRARGYRGGVAQVRRYVRTVRPTPKAEAYLRLSTLPGEQAQVDWGSFGKITVGSAQRNLSCFVLVLSWSRGMYARFMLDQTLESFMRGHISAFEALGGVPRTILYDNLKSVVLERDGDAIRFHPRLLELAGHYHFVPKPCAPYRGNEKGKVERTIRYLRDSFFAARSFRSLHDLNAQLAKWIEEVAHARRVPRGGAELIVDEALTAERPKLLPLPEHRFETDSIAPVRSGKTPYVRFDCNDYSIPHTAVRKPLTIIASEAVVRIVDGATEIARHQRSYDKAQIVESPAHIEGLASMKRQAHELRGRDLLRTVCKSADAMLKALAERGDLLAPHTTRMLKLLDRYGARELERALQDALARGALGSEAVAHVLDQRDRKRKQPPRLHTPLSGDPRIANLRVPQHELTAYDRLGKSDDEENQ